MSEQTEDDDDGSATFKMIAKVRNNDDPVDSGAIIDEASLVSNVYSESEFFRSGSGHQPAHAMSPRPDPGKLLAG